MTRDQALSVLAKLKPQLQNQFGVSELALFGSAARDELHVGSDIDVLVKTYLLRLHATMASSSLSKMQSGCPSIW